MSGQTKKLLNDVSTCVDELLLGFTRAHPGLRLNAESRVIQIDSWEHSKTAIISGGGSGHEPFAAGFVGKGMLTASVAGSVFASPPSGNIVAAIRSVTHRGRNSALVVVPNYTGDCLNFGLAVERLRSDGFEIDVVVVGDDCALSEKLSTGCRGMCGLLFVYKICGNMSDTGKPLADLASTANLIVSSMATIGVGLSACSLPGSTGPLFNLAADKIELGLGVHGEAGSATIELCSAAEVVSQMLARLVARLQLRRGDEVAVLVNNLGGSSQLEQWVFVAETEKQLLQAGITALRIYAGHLMTSLETPGFQISLLKLVPSEKSHWLTCLDAETDAPSWPGGKYSFANKTLNQKRDFQSKEHKDTKSVANGLSAEVLTSLNSTQQCLLTAAKALNSSEQKLNSLDSGCGDGDCGTTLSRFAAGIIQKLTILNTSKPSIMLQELAEISEDCMGGTSGAIYSLFLTTSGAAMSLKGCEGDWALAWEKGLDGIMKYSKARLGDRTMLDALIPACEQFKNHPRHDTKESLHALGKAVEAAQIGCVGTRDMLASVGRASYVSAAHVTDVDAGAYGVTIWLHAIYQSLMEMSQIFEGSL